MKRFVQAFVFVVAVLLCRATVLAYDFGKTITYGGQSMPIKDYSTVADQNTTISGINIAEGCPPSGINNAIRQLMADVRAKTDSQDTAISAPIGGKEVVSTGATSSRSIQDRFADIVSVKDFGAKGDGVADDSDAIQAAFDTNRGPIVFPTGNYKITKTINVSSAERQNVDFCESVVSWYGEQGGVMFHATGPMKVFENGYLYGRALAKTALWIDAQGSRVINMIMRDCSDGCLVIGNADSGRSINVVVDKVQIYKYIGLKGAEDGSGIIIHEPDNKLTNVVVIGYKTSVYQRTHGNLFTNCHFCFQLPDGSPSPDGNYVSYGVYFDPKSSTRVYCDKYTNVYFDNHKYCFYAKSKNTSRVDAENCWYFNSGAQVASGVTSFNAYLSGGQPIPITAHNFTIAAPSRCNFIDSALNFTRGSTGAFFTDLSLIDTSYNRSSFPHSAQIPYRAEFKADSGKPVLVINAGDSYSAGENVCVGCVVAPVSSSQMTRVAPVEISGNNRGYSMWRATLSVNPSTSKMRVIDSTVSQSDTNFAFKVGALKMVQIDGKECAVWPLYLTTAASISSTVYYMSATSLGGTQVYLVNGQKLTFPSSEYDVEFSLVKEPPMAN